MIVSAFGLAVVVLGIVLSRTRLLRLQVMLCVFANTAAVTLASLGGATVVVPVMCLPFFWLRGWLEAHQYGANFSRIPKAGFWLLATVLWAALTALVLPRALEGLVEVMILDRFGGESGTRLAPIRPVSGNLTQSFYAVGNVATFLAARYLLRFQYRVQAYRDAMLWLAGLNCAAAIINLAEFYAGFPAVLDYVRTAYAVFDTGEARGTGLMRIHGTFSETSSFSAFSLTLFGFTFSLWMQRVRQAWSGTCAGLLLLFLALSTSGTAYAGLLIYGSIVTLLLLRKKYIEGKIPRIVLLFPAGLLVVAVVGSLVVFEAPVVDRISAFFEVTLIDKMESDSGQTRGSWNAAAWNVFLETYGLGVGLGTARASSFVLVLLSNLGIVGTTLYGLFLWHVLRPSPTSQGELIDTTAEAARHAMLASLAAAIVSGTGFERGVEFYLAAAVSSLRLPAAERQESPEAQRSPLRASSAGRWARVP